MNGTTDPAYVERREPRTARQRFDAVTLRLIGMIIMVSLEPQNWRSLERGPEWVRTVFLLATYVAAALTAVDFCRKRKGRDLLTGATDRRERGIEYFVLLGAKGEAARKLVLGADGLHMGSDDGGDDYLGRSETFVPFARIRRVRPVASRIEIHFEGANGPEVLAVRPAGYADGRRMLWEFDQVLGVPGRTA